MKLARNDAKLVIQDKELEIKQVWYTLQTNSLMVCAKQCIPVYSRNGIHTTFLNVNWYFMVSKQFSTRLNF